jgi:hypothetical protein
MNRRQQNIFALVINFFTPNWKPHHVIVSFFEDNDTTRKGLAKQLKVSFESFSLTSKVICFVKYERIIKNHGNNFKIIDFMGLSSKTPTKCFTLSHKDP